MKIILTIGIALFIVVLCLLWFPERPPKTGTRSYYGKDRYLIAVVHGEYLGDCFVPCINLHLSQELRDRIVLVETIPDVLK